MANQTDIGPLEFYRLMCFEGWTWRQARNLVAKHYGNSALETVDAYIARRRKS